MRIPNFIPFALDTPLISQEHICAAKLILPRDKAVWHPSGLCHEPAAGNKRRCARHGGKCTGARTPEGMAAQVRGLVAGRNRWLARAKAEGQPLAFAGFRPKGSGITREARSQAKAARAIERETYATSKEAASQAQHLARAVRSLIPEYIRQDHFTNPVTVAHTDRALALHTALDALPAEGPFAEKIAHAKRKSWGVTFTIALTGLMAETDAERKEAERVEGERQAERNLQTLLENNRRWHAIKAAAENR